MINKITASTKLYLLIFIAATSLIGLGFYGIGGLKKMNENTRTLYADRVLCIQQLLKIRFEYGTNILPVPQNIKNHTITFGEAKKRILNAQAIIDTNWYNYKLTSQTPEEKLLVRQTELSKKRADEATQNLLSILAKEDTLAIAKIIQNVITPKTASFTLNINQLIDLQVRVAKEIINDDDKLYRDTSRNFFLLILLSLAIVLPISFYIIKNIRNLIGDIVTSRDIIKESENQYRSILENASDAIYLVDNEGRFIEANDSMCKMVGYSKEELLQLKVEDVYDNEQLKTDPINLSLFPSQSTFKQRRLIRKDGTTVEVEINGKRLNKKKLIGIARDTTERNKIEAERREADMKFRTLAEKSMVGVYITQNKRFLYANPRFAEIFGYEVRELMDLNGIIDTIYAEESRGMIREKIRARDNGETEGAHYEAVGLKKDGTTNLVEFYGNRVTIAGQPAVIGTALDITERKRAEELIIKEKELSNTIINSLPGIFYLRDAQGKGLRWNKNVEEVTGYTADEIEGAVLRNFIAEEDREAMRRAAETTFNDGYSSVEVKVVTKKGEKIPYLLTGKPIIYENQLCLLGTGIDISSRVKAEEELKLSEERFRRAFEDSAIGMGLTSIEEDSMGKWLKVNRSLCEMLGYTERELLSRTFMQITHPEDLARDLAAQDRILQGESDTYRLEKRYIHKNGNFVWINLNVSIVRDKDKTPIYLVAQVENITQKVESQIKFQNLVENFIVGVYIHQNGKIVYVNPRALEESGYAEDDLIGRPFDQFVYEDDKDFVKKITETREKGQIDTTRYEARFVKKDGQLIWFELFGSRTIYQGAPALMGTMINITERKAAHEELTKSEANLRSIFDATDVSYLMLDTTYNIIALNQQMRDIYHDNVGIILKEGDNLIDLIRTERRQMMRELYDGVQHTKKPSAYESSFNNGGVEKHFAASVIPITVEDKTIGICISTIDITQQKNALEKLKEANENLQRHAKELAISNAELEQFAFAASHDLQEPLRMVTSFMSQLEKKYSDVVDDKGRKYIHFAVDGAKRMRQIILDLLEFSRVGRTEDDMEEVNFNKLLNEILSLYRRQTEEMRAIISFENLPTFHTYKTPVRQVFQNLVGNSLKYHKADEPPIISITFEETKMHFQFAVKDNGIGISPKYFDKIFIIFQRLHYKEEYSGTGMGLAITKKIVENLGGKIWVESEEGNGCTFYFTLPKNNR